MKVYSQAKINIGLDIINKRQDGYHNIKTIMYQIPLFEEMFFEKSTELKIEMVGIENLRLEDNIIYKSYLALKNFTNKDLPFTCKLIKNVPYGAGLAGGTFNGANTLKFLNSAYDLDLSLKELEKIGKNIGADFPYCLNGGVFLAEGIGDILQKIQMPKLNILLINPGYEISTKEVYEKIRIDNKRVDFNKIRSSILSKDLDGLRENLINKMEEPVFEKHPDLYDLKEKISSFNAAGLLSGSGSSLFGIFMNKEDLKRAYNYFKDIYDKVYGFGGEDV